MCKKGENNPQTKCAEHMQNICKQGAVRVNSCRKFATHIKKGPGPGPPPQICAGPGPGPGPAQIWGPRPGPFFICFAHFMHKLCTCWYAFSAHYCAHFLHMFVRIFCVNCAHFGAHFCTLFAHILYIFWAFC